MLFEGGPIDLRHFIEQVTLAGERIDCFLMGHATTFPGMDHGIQRARRAMLTGFKGPRRRPPPGRFYPITGRSDFRPLEWCASWANRFTGGLAGTGGSNRRDYRQLEVGRLEFRRPLFQTSPQLVQRQ